MNRIPFVLFLSLSILLRAEEPGFPNSLYPTESEYTMHWWAYGSPQSGNTRRGNIRDLSNENQILCLQTGEFVAAIDVRKMKWLHWGALNHLPVEKGLKLSFEEVSKLPAASMKL